MAPSKSMHFIPCLKGVPANHRGLHRRGSARVRFRGSPHPPQVLQILECRQILHLELHPQALRTSAQKHHTYPWKHTESQIVEWLRRASAVMARAEHGYPPGLLLHLVECDMLGNIHAGFSWSSTFIRGRP